MAGFLLVSGADSSLSLEALYRGGRDRRDPLLSAFEKEIDFILKPLLRRNKKPLNRETCQKLSNSLFSLWNKYQHKLSLEFFTTQLLRVADLFYEAGLYHVARTHGYRRCLAQAGLLELSGTGEEKGDEEDLLEDYVSSCDSKAVALAILRCEIGDAMCLYFLAIEKDPKLMERCTRSLATSTLSRLRRLSRVALLREDRYWLAYNAFVHSFTICCKLMKYGHHLRVIEYLIWCAVCMESSVPLMASKYLGLRTNFYVAATQCYYSINQHSQAEMFARRALDKVNELVQLESQSSSEPTVDSGCIYKEAAIKLGVLVFKRSIFESHKKIKQPFKYKFRVTVKDLLQLPSPRSSTEKLLSEMFTNPNAQYLAILETLTDNSRRALNRGPPPQHGDSENEVYIELFAAGLDLSLKTLTAYPTTPPDPSHPPGIMESAIHDKVLIPLEALVKFVRIAHIYEQKDVMKILGEKVIQATQMSDDQAVIGKGKALQLMLAMELLSSAHKRCISAATHSGARRNALSAGTFKRGTSAVFGMPMVGRVQRRRSSIAPINMGVDELGQLSAQPGGKAERLSPLLGASRRLKRLSGIRKTSPVPGAKGDGKGARKASPGGGGGKGGRLSAGGGTGKGGGKGGSGGRGRVKDETRKESGGSGGVDSNDESHTTSPAVDLHESLVKVIHFLHFTLQTTPSLVMIDYDLLLDSLVMCWEVLHPALSCITTHDYHGCRAFLTHSTGMLFAQLLSELVAVSHWLELWRVDTLLHGELCLKHCCILEARAESRDLPGTVDSVPVTFMGHDRSQLLSCRQELERADSFIKMGREREMRGGVGGKGEMGGGEVEAEEDLAMDLAILHAECVYALTRVQVKLASTNPPPDFLECEDKASSLKSKVKEREDRQKQKQHLLSQLTSREVKVPTLAELRQACGKSHYRQGLLLMLQATNTPGLEVSQRYKLMEESYNQLLLEQQWLADSQSPQTVGTTSTTSASHFLAPPTLMGATETSMVFSPPPAPPPDFEDTPPEQPAYYKLFGRVAAGSNVKVREVDRLFPGLGMEVPAEEGCQLEVHGLQPFEDYVFAVATFTKEGAMLGKAIGNTSRPLRTTFSLPLLTAWGYCCQCAFTVGCKAVATKSSKILWNHFVSDDSRRPKSGRYRLKRSLLSPTLSTHLHLFVSSILISSQLGFTQSSLLADQLYTRQGQLLPNQLQRVELVRKLLVGVEVAGILNNAQLCLQMVVKCYGLLAPLLQHRISSRPVVEMLIHCQAVLLELPDSLLNTKSTVITASLHHMVAAIAYYVGKILLSWHNKTLFSRFTESARSLMLVTLSGAVANSMTPGDSVLEEATSANPLDQSSFVSSIQDPALSSFATVINSITTIQPPMDSGTKKKKNRKKVHILADHIPEESKTAELKAIEAFLVANQQQLDDLDLSGGEDPIILHFIINSHPSIVAHREVLKFKRRPQFMEMLVHLLNLTLAKGHFDRVVEWAAEGFQWLTRRNEVLLNPRITQRLAGEQIVTGKGRIAKGTHLFSNVPSKSDLRKFAQKAMHKDVSSGSGVVTVPVSNSSAPKHPRVHHTTSGTVDTTAPKKKANLSQGSSVPKSIQGRREAVASARQYSVRKSMLPSIAAELSSQVRITKEDLEAKSVYILITKLPELWRLHRCRKRLRSVSFDELPWRSQANLTLASCYLNQALVRLRSEFKEDAEKGEESGGRATSDGLRLDMAGVIIEGVIPAWPAAMAGQGSKPLSSARSRTRERDRDESGTTPSSITLHPVQSSSVQTLVVDDIRHAMTCYQRAVVLADRGNLWTTLQNIARSLWNAINTLLQAASRFGREMREANMAIIYGLASKPLYFVAEGLITLLKDCDYGAQRLPQVSSLTFTPGMDDSNGVGVAVIKQVVFLAIHTLYVHQHWEKVISLGLQFDDVTNHSWADQLVPILSSAQASLSDRVASHNFSQPMRRTKLEPAAHLDPGPKGYNVYGTVGFSLHMVPEVLLDRQDVLRRVDLLHDMCGDERACQEVMLDCRRLLQRYCAGVKGVGVITGGGIEEYLSKDIPAVSALGKSQVSVLVAAYSKALPILQKAGNRDLTVQAMNELGDVMMLAGNAKMSRHWWLEGLSEVLGIKTPLTSWRQVLPITLKGCGGLWACLQGAMMATKLLRHVYWKHLDVRLECALLAAALLKATFTYTLPYPSSDIAYATLDHTPSTLGGGASLFPGVELFSDPFRCNPAHLLFAMQWCSRELITRGYAKKSLPVLWLYNHVAAVDCRSVQEAVTAKILRLRVLTQLSLFSAAIQQLLELLTGSGLPQGSTHSTRPAESSVALPKFQDHLPISDPANSKVLFTVVEKHLKQSQLSLYGALNISQLAVARALLYITLAQSQSIIAVPISSTSFSLATGPLLSSVQSTLSPCPSGGESTPSGNSPSGGKDRDSVFPRLLSPSSRTRTRPNVKLALIYGAERLLGVLNQQQEAYKSAEHMEIQVRALLGLAQLSVALQHCVTGYQLSLQGLRLLQILEEGGGRGKEGVALLRNVDLYLWMECRYWMSRSVVGLEAPPGGGSLLLEVGEHCEECGQHGEVELVAEMECTAAEHALSLLPCQLQAAQQHSQRCLEMLGSLPELSHRGELLSTKATLILSDTTSVLGTGPSPSVKAAATGEQMVEVYGKLIETIRKQISEEQVLSSPINIYQPRYSLLASSLLRLGHTLTLMASRETQEPGSRRGKLQRAQECFKEGIEVMQDCSHCDPSLSAELLIGNGLAMAALPDFKLDDSISMLARSGKMLVDGGTDYRLASIVFLTLAELYNKKRAKCLKRADHRKSVSIVINANETLKATADQEKEKAGWEGKWDKGGWEFGGKEGYLAWCMVKSALKTSTTRQTLLGFASSTNNSDMTKPLSDKILHEMPDFVLLELQSQCDTLDTLTNKPVVLPIEALLPSRQFRPKKCVNWFKVINYYNRLIQRCYWQKVALHLSDSDWALCYNFATPSVYTRAKAVFNFLNSHCSAFKACVMPSLPHLSMLPGGTFTPWTGGVITHRDPHLVASDADVTIVWCNNPFSSLFATTSQPPLDLPVSDRITGYFAMNLRAVNFPIHTEPYLLGIETHIIHTSVRELSEVHGSWEELVKLVSSYLDTRATMRPVSRSPSKMRKAEKSIQPPEEVVAGIPKTVKEVATFLQSKAKLPTVEPHAVAGLTKIMEPFSQTTLKGDAYFFLKELFSQKQ